MTPFFMITPRLSTTPRSALGIYLNRLPTVLFCQKTIKGPFYLPQSPGHFRKLIPAAPSCEPGAS